MTNCLCLIEYPIHELANYAVQATTAKLKHRLACGIQKHGDSNH